MGIFGEVVNLLYKHNMFDLAANFIAACEEANLPLNDVSTVLPDDLAKPLSAGSLNKSPNMLDNQVNEKLIAMKTLQLNVYKKYAAFLDGLNNKSLSQVFVQKAKQIKEQYNLEEDLTISTSTTTTTSQVPPMSPTRTESLMLQPNQTTDLLNLDDTVTTTTASNVIYSPTSPDSASWVQVADEQLQQQ